MSVTPIPNTEPEPTPPEVHDAVAAVEPTDDVDGESDGLHEAEIDWAPWIGDVGWPEW